MRIRLTRGFGNRLMNVMTDDAILSRTIKTPLGELVCVSSARGVRRVSFFADEPHETVRGETSHSHRHLDLLAQELDAYFRGELHNFSVSLDPAGTEFQRRVWRLLAGIPFGETRSYAWIADRLGSPGASRAVGSANGANPIPIIMPCHRVISSDGSLGGYTGGIERKRWLLEHEQGRELALFALGDGDRLTPD